jgi:hypothetical protein
MASMEMSMSKSSVAKWREQLREQGKKSITIWLDSEDEARLKALARTWYCSPSEVLHRVLANAEPGAPPHISSTTEILQEYHGSITVAEQIQTILRSDLPGLVRAICEEWRQDWPAGTSVPEPTYAPMPAPAPKNRGGRQPSALNQAIVQLLADHPEGLTADEIRVYVHAQKQTGDTLSGMVTRGRLRAIGTGKQKRYALPPA